MYLLLTSQAYLPKINGVQPPQVLSAADPRLQCVGHFGARGSGAGGGREGNAQERPAGSSTVLGGSYTRGRA